jgi:hypothetical protein
MKTRSILIVALLLLFKFTLVFLIIPQFYDGAIDATYEINKFKDDYDKIAVNIIEGRGYRIHPDTAATMMRPPAYVMVLCAVFYLFGKSLLAVQYCDSYVVVLLSPGYDSGRKSRRS